MKYQVGKLVDVEELSAERIKAIIRGRQYDNLVVLTPAGYKPFKDVFRKQLNAQAQRQKTQGEVPSSAPTIADHRNSKLGSNTPPPPPAIQEFAPAEKADDVALAELRRRYYSKTTRPTFGNRITKMSIFAALGAVVAIVLYATVFKVSFNNPGLAMKARANWNHADLIQHLKGRGVPLETMKTHIGGYWGPALVFDFTPNNPSDIYYELRIDGTRQRRPNIEGGCEVYVQLRKTVQEAKDYAAAEPDIYQWGRFIFRGRSPAIDTLIRNLP